MEIETTKSTCVDASRGVSSSVTRQQYFVSIRSEPEQRTRTRLSRRCILLLAVVGSRSSGRRVRIRGSRGFLLVLGLTLAFVLAARLFLLFLALSLVQHLPLAILVALLLSGWTRESFILSANEHS